MSRRPPAAIHRREPGPGRRRHAAVMIVAVFLAYNANTGPAVRAHLRPQGRAPERREARARATRCASAASASASSTTIEPTVDDRRQDRAVAVVNMKLDKVGRAAPRRHERSAIRPRSALGLKYVEITPGTVEEEFAAGDTIPLAQTPASRSTSRTSSATFDGKTRDNVARRLDGLRRRVRRPRRSRSTTAIAALNPFFPLLTPVMQNLSDPHTELDQFFRQLGRASAEVAPVAHVQAELFANMADTFEAFGRDPRPPGRRSRSSPPTLDVVDRARSASSARSSPTSPTCRGSLRPAAQELPTLAARRSTRRSRSAPRCCRARWS